MDMPSLTKTSAQIFSVRGLDCWAGIHAVLPNLNKSAMFQMTRASWDHTGSHIERS